jgi:hypothetical protein
VALVAERNRPGVWLVGFAILLPLLLVAGCDRLAEDSRELPMRSFVDQVGTQFVEIDSYAFKGPDIREIPLNFSASTKAIWGAIGRSDQGKLYLGASAHKGSDSTALLYRYDPITSRFEAQGSVTEQLRRLGLFELGMGQNKLHSKFYQADDGYIYFSSFDEQGEGVGIHPTWGGHLWRKKDDEKVWEHLITTREALIAVNLSGQYVYALGYWGHLLYQYNTENGQVNRVAVGSVPNHVSRNFLVDPKGHAYVPAVSIAPSGEVSATLNEYDTGLNLVGSYSMPSYRSDDMKRHHGIIGYTSMASGNIVFTTSDGGLYELRVFATLAEKLDYKGMMHPEGDAYIPSLFPLDGGSLVVGVGRVPGRSHYEWIIYELQAEIAVTYKLDTGELQKLQLYGTSTRDDAGNFYLVGRSNTADGKSFRPVMLVIPLESLWPAS